MTPEAPRGFDRQINFTPVALDFSRPGEAVFDANQQNSESANQQISKATTWKIGT
jgi:hypothetical protein